MITQWFKFDKQQKRIKLKKIVYPDGEERDK